MRQDFQLEGVELEVLLLDLLPELPVEEVDAGVCVHGGICAPGRVEQLPVCLLPASRASLR
jgi:hypothetical protein